MVIFANACYDEWLKFRLKIDQSKLMKSRYHLLLLLIALLLFSAIYQFSEQFQKIIFRGTQIDSIGHILSFFILTWVLHNILKLPLFISVITLIFYGVLTELGQLYLGFRNAELNDFYADIFGIVLFIIIHKIFHRFLSRTTS